MTPRLSEACRASRPTGHRPSPRAPRRRGSRRGEGSGWALEWTGALPHWSGWAAQASFFVSTRALGLCVRAEHRSVHCTAPPVPPAEEANPAARHPVLRVPRSSARAAEGRVERERFGHAWIFFFLQWIRYAWIRIPILLFVIFNPNYDTNTNFRKIQTKTARISIHVQLTLT
jgi:hypothetical protein